MPGSSRNLVSEDDAAQAQPLLSSIDAGPTDNNSSSTPTANRQSGAEQEEEPNYIIPTESNHPPIIPKSNAKTATLLIIWTSLCIAIFNFISIPWYDVLYDVVCREYGIDSDSCSSDPRVQNAVTDYFTVSSIVGSIQLITVPYLSSLMDRWGRRPIAMLSVWLIFWSLCSYAFLPYGVPSHVTHWRMLAIDTIMALAGGGAVLLNALTLTIMELLPEIEEQSRYMSWLSGSVHISTALAQAVAGMAFSKYGFSKLASFSLISFIFILVSGYLVFPETESESNRIRSARENGPKINVKNVAKTLFFAGDEFSKETKRNGRILVLAALIGAETMIGLSTMLDLYGKNQFGWNSRDLGVKGFATSSIGGFWGMIGFPLLYRYICRMYTPAPPYTVFKGDVTVLVISQLLDSISYLLMALAPTSLTYMFAIILGSNSTLAGPLHLNSVMRLIQPYMRGEFLAARSFVTTVGIVVVPAAFITFYGWTSQVFPQALFFLVSICSSVVLALYFFIKPSAAPTTPAA